MRALVSLVVLASLAGQVQADDGAPGIPTDKASEQGPWYRGPYGISRAMNLAITVGGGIVYISSESFLKSSLAADPCRWCKPDSLDTGVRDALLWSSPGTAEGISNLTGYFAAPVFGIGMTLAGSLTSPQSSWTRMFDDTLPVFESVVVGQLVTQLVKFSAGRQRPFVHFGDPARPPQLDDNLSFFSGHSALAFSVVTSAGVIAHRRHYWTEPYIWGGGLVLASATAYLRVAADKHYFTDVLAGSAVGVMAGLAVPLLMWHEQLEVVPTRNGLALAGMF